MWPKVQKFKTLVRKLRQFDPRSERSQSAIGLMINIENELARSINSPELDETRPVVVTSIWN